MNTADAMQNLNDLDREARAANPDDTALSMICRGVPADVVAYLMDLWDKTKTIGRKVYAVGRIIVLRIWQFIRDNPGIAGGVAVGVAAAALVHGIPLLGPLLAPLAGLTVGLVGVAVGHKHLLERRGHKVGAVMALMDAAAECMRLLVDLWCAVFPPGTNAPAGLPATA